MATRELQAPSAKVRVTPASAEEPTAYGAVDITWYPDRLEITAIGAGRASVVEGFASGGRDVTVEIRPPDLAELLETMPGAD